MKLRPVRDVEIFPYDGHYEEPWVEDDFLWDRFSRASRGVSERFSELVAEGGGLLPAGLVRLSGGRPDGGLDAPRISLLIRPIPFLYGLIQLPPAMALATDIALVRVALEILRLSTLALADRCGSEPDPFEEAYQEALREGPEPTWRGPWKSAPGRKRRARLALTIKPSGFADLWIEAADSDSDEIVAVSNSVTTPGNLVSFRRIQKDWRWLSPTMAICDSSEIRGQQIKGSPRITALLDTTITSRNTDANIEKMDARPGFEPLEWCHPIVTFETQL